MDNSGYSQYIICTDEQVTVWKAIEVPKRYDNWSLALNGAVIWLFEVAVTVDLGTYCLWYWKN